MYCKFCGNRITADETMCGSCGAPIDLNDGGQSFFDDKELEAWKSERVLQETSVSVPKTEMREPFVPKSLPNDEVVKEDHRTLPQAGVYAAVPYADYGKKKERKKKSCGVSGSNKLIVFCIVAVLAIVLLTVAVIAIFNGNKEKTESETSQSGYTMNRDAVSAEKSTPDTSGETSEQETSEQESVESEEVIPEILNHKTEMKDIKIVDKNGNEIPYSVSAYIDEQGVFYISLDTLLKYTGYKNGVENGNDSNRIVYEHRSGTKVIEIEKETNKIWITKSGEEAVTKYLDYANFNVGDHTYVPVKSFLGKCGYEENQVTWDVQEKMLYLPVTESSEI